MNLSKNTIKISTSNMSEEEWLKLRERGLGGSDIGALLGLSNYQSPLELYLRKLGEDVYAFEGNAYTMAGTHDETIIRNRSQYFELGEDSMTMWRNKEKGKKVRKCKAYNYMIFHKEFPIFANTDGIFYENGSRGLLEVKTTTSYAARNYVEGLNPSYIAQTQLYLMLTGFERCLLIQRIDGVEYQMYEFYPDDGFHEHILDKAQEFWKKIVGARMIKEEYGITKYYGVPMEHFDIKQRDGVRLLQALEPELTGAATELECIRRIVKPTEELSRCVGTDVALDLAQTYLEYQVKSKAEKQAMNKVTAEIILGLEGNHEMVWLDPKDREIKLSYKPDARGRNRLYVSPKLMEKILPNLTA